MSSKWSELGLADTAFGCVICLREGSRAEIELLQAICENLALKILADKITKLHRGFEVDDDCNLFTQNA